MSHEKCEAIPPLRFEVLTSFYNDMDTFLMGNLNLSDKVRGGYNRLRHFHAIVPDEVAYKVALDSLDLESLSERLTYLPPCLPHFILLLHSVPLSLLPSTPSLLTLVSLISLATTTTVLCSLTRP